MPILRKLYYLLPPAWRFLARRLYYLPADLYEGLSGQRDAMTPPRGLIYTGSGDFRAQGEKMRGYLAELAGLQPRHRVLDALVFWFHEKVLGTTATSLYWRTFLRSIYGDPSRVTPAQVERYRVLNNFPGRDAEFRADEAAGIYLARGGSNPLALYSVLQKMTALGASSPALAQLYRTHPALDTRMDRIDQRAYAGLEAYTRR